MKYLTERWKCDECGSELPERIDWGPNHYNRVPGKCTNPDCPTTDY